MSFDWKLAWVLASFWSCHNINKPSFMQRDRQPAS